MSEHADEPWIALLAADDRQAAWDAFIERYRRLIFAAIRHYARDYDDVMDVFAGVCEALCRDDYRRLRSYIAQTEHRAKFSTWLVTVVRHLTVDWFRARDGRRRVSAVAERLPALERRIFELVFVDGHSHVEAFERLRAGPAPGLSYREFQSALRAVYDSTAKRKGGLLLPGLARRPPELDEEGAPDARELAERSAVLEQALASLVPEDRVAVELYVIEELPAADVARVLRMPSAKAVYNRVYRILDALRDQLGARGISRDDV